MNTENYVNYYVEILTATLQEAILKNISMQANAKVSEDVINDFARLKEELENTINHLNTNGSVEVEQLKNTISQHQETIDRLNGEINSVGNLRNEYEAVKHQAGHVDTFRNELAKARKENEKIVNDYELRIKELNDKIEYLQLTPAKRKKLDDAKAQATATPIVDMTEDITTKDGGSF